MARAAAPAGSTSATCRATRYHGPSFQNVDLSLVKNTALGGRARLQVRLDTFNVFNHANFSNPLLPNFAIDFLQNGIDPATNRGIGLPAADGDARRRRWQPVPGRRRAARVPAGGAGEFLGPWGHGSMGPWVRLSMTTWHCCGKMWPIVLPTR